MVHRNKKRNSFDTPTRKTFEYYTSLVLPFWGKKCNCAGRPYIPAFSLSGTVPAFTCDCLRFVCAITRRRKFDLCVSTSSRTMLAFGNNVSCSSVAHVLLLRFVAGNMDVNTLASKRSELIGNTAIVRKRCVIHKTSTCVCLRLSVAAFMRKRRDVRFDLWPA